MNGLKKDLKQRIKRLQREGLVVRIEKGVKHDRLILCNGLTYTCSQSPSDYRGLQNLVSQIRRMTLDRV
jgi:hypothetical protein